MTKSYYVYYTPLKEDGTPHVEYRNTISVHGASDGESAMEIVKNVLESDPSLNNHRYVDMSVRLQSIDVGEDYEGF